MASSNGVSMLVYMGIVMVLFLNWYFITIKSFLPIYVLTFVDSSLNAFPNKFN